MRSGKLVHVTMGEISRNHVERALAEYDDLGRADFLTKYGFGYATTYLLRVGGRLYDPKAVVGVAHQYTSSGQLLAAGDFDATEAIARLRALDYEVVEFNGLWWVNQGATYRQEFAGSYVWAPKRTRAGFEAAHHKAVSDLRVGQRVVHYAQGHIRAIGIVIASPESYAKPDELTGDAWETDGNICRVAYHELEQPIPLADVPNRVPTVGPFNVNGAVNQGYLYRISDPELMPLLEFLAAAYPWIFDRYDGEVPPLPQENPKEVPMLDADPLHDLLHDTRNVVLEGVPGTGKTFAIEKLAKEWQQRTGRELMEFNGVPYRALVMHPSTSYEDFVEGLRPQVATPEGDGPMFDESVKSTGTFGIEDGFFVDVCRKAAAWPDKDVLVLLDEMNRCNVASVLGDLLLVLEGSRRATFVGSDPSNASARDWRTAVPVRLPYSGRTFFVPSNVYVVATANTTDRSVAPLDAALRRRFAFFRLDPRMPDEAELAATVPGKALTHLAQSGHALESLNRNALGPCLGPDAMLGHSYIFALGRQLAIAAEADFEAVIARHWRFTILPQVIDSVRSFGAEDLLSSDARADWFSQHPELETSILEAGSALTAFDAFLRRIGLRVVVEGTGLSRGARIADGVPDPPASLLEAQLEAQLEDPQ